MTSDDLRKYDRIVIAHREDMFAASPRAYQLTAKLRDGGEINYTLQEWEDVERLLKRAIPIE